MNWRPLQFSAFNESHYSFTAVHPEDRPIARVVEKYCRSSSVHPDHAPKWILGQAGGRSFFGRFGDMGDFLGWNHPAARDEVSRKLACFLAYSAEDAAMPRFADLAALEEPGGPIRNDLERLWKEIKETGKPISNPPMTEIHLPGSAPTEHLWDKVAVALEKGGKGQPLIIIDNQGNVRQEMPPPIPPDLEKKTNPTGTATAERAPPALATAEEKTASAVRKISGNGFAVLWAGAAIAAALIIGMIYHMMTPRKNPPYPSANNPSGPVTAVRQPADGEDRPANERSWAERTKQQGLTTLGQSR